MIIEEEVYLTHHGVRGMKWGQRKSKEESSRSSDNKMSNKKKVAGLVLGAAAVGAGAYFLKKHYNVSLKEMPKPSSVTERFVEETLHEPTSVVHATRGKNRGFGFLADGGLKDPLGEWESVGPGLHEDAGDVYKRYGKNMEKVAVAFKDPLGRTDASGRVIPHLVMLPKEHAKGINDFESAKKKAWSLTKDTFNSLYGSEFDKRYS